MGLRKIMEAAAWRLAGFQGYGRVRFTSRIKAIPNPLELTPDPTRHALILSPHPDDDVLGCGGTMCRFLSAGVPVQVLYITDGARGGDPRRRQQEVLRTQKICSETIGNTFDVRFLNHKEMGINEGRFKKELSEVMDDFSPRLIFIPGSGDNHRDHSEVNRIAISLLRSYPDCKILGYEVWSTLTPRVFCDISRFIGLKGDLIRSHESQMTSKAFDEIILALNRYRGGCLSPSISYAETFEILGEKE